MHPPDYNNLVCLKRKLKVPKSGPDAENHFPVSDRTFLRSTNAVLAIVIALVNDLAAARIPWDARNVVVPSLDEDPFQKASFGIKDS